MIDLLGVWEGMYKTEYMFTDNPARHPPKPYNTQIEISINQGYFWGPVIRIMIFRTLYWGPPYPTGSKVEPSFCKLGRSGVAPTQSPCAGQLESDMR